jgi:transposase
MIPQVEHIILYLCKKNNDMKLTKAQYDTVSESFPTQRGNVSLSNLEILNAILYVLENGCKWRALPPYFGN